MSRGAAPCLRGAVLAPPAASGAQRARGVSRPAPWVCAPVLLQPGWRETRCTATRVPGAAGCTLAQPAGAIFPSPTGERAGGGVERPPFPPRGVAGRGGRRPCLQRPARSRAAARCSPGRGAWWHLRTDRTPPFCPQPEGKKDPNPYFPDNFPSQAARGAHPRATREGEGSLGPPRGRCRLLAGRGEAGWFLGGSWQETGQCPTGIKADRVVFLY